MSRSTKDKQRVRRKSDRPRIPKRGGSQTIESRYLSYPIRRFNDSQSVSDSANTRRVIWKSLQQNYADNNCIEHGLCTELVSLLNPPETVDADRLSRDADKKEVR